MKGSLIFLGLVAVLGGLLWWALVGGGSVDKERGREETEIAFGLLEEEIRAMDEAFIPLTRMGYLLNLKRRHEELRSGLSKLKAQRLELETDEQLDPRSRLTAFRDLVNSSDMLLAQARSLHAHTRARYNYMIQVSPLLKRARALAGLLEAAETEDPELVARRDSLAGTFADLERGSKIADNVLTQNMEQGSALAQSEILNLRRLIENQEKLARSLALDVPPADQAER